MTATDTTVIRAQMEALAGHTPMPWHMNGPKAMEIVGRVHRVLNPENYPAAFVPAWDQPEAGGVDGKDEAIANARLIAAAPDMRATILALCDAQDSLCNALDEARAENERLRAALTEAADELDAYYQEEYGQDHPVHQQKLRWAKEGNPARAALAQKGGG